MLDDDGERQEAVCLGQSCDFAEWEFMEYRCGDDQSRSGVMLAAQFWGLGDWPLISLRPLPHLLRLLYRACNLLKARMTCKGCSRRASYGHHPA